MYLILPRILSRVLQFARKKVSRMLSRVLHFTIKKVKEEDICLMSEGLNLKIIVEYLKEIIKINLNYYLNKRDFPEEIEGK